MTYACVAEWKSTQVVKIPKNTISNTGTLNYLISMSDQHLISPNNTSPESHIQVMRKKEMITNYRNSLQFNNFSLSAPQKMNNEK